MATARKKAGAHSDTQGQDLGEGKSISPRDRGEPLLTWKQLISCCVGACGLLISAGVWALNQEDKEDVAVKNEILAKVEACTIDLKHTVSRLVADSEAKLEKQNQALDGRTVAGLASIQKSLEEIGRDLQSWTSGNVEFKRSLSEGLVEILVDAAVSTLSSAEVVQRCRILFHDDGKATIFLLPSIHTVPDAQCTVDLSSKINSTPLVLRSRAIGSVQVARDAYLSAQKSIEMSLRLLRRLDCPAKVENVRDLRVKELENKKVDADSALARLNSIIDSLSK